jgi:DNA-binding NtrC family response regulator
LGRVFFPPDWARDLGQMATILLVDDDPLQAYRCKALLGSKYSDVRRVSDAAEALCLVEQPQFASSLGLVVSGHHMPGIGGPAFVAELHNRMPSLPVLVLGDTGEKPADYEGAHVRFLPRPAASDDILNAAGQMLSRDGDNGRGKAGVSLNAPVREN